MRPNVPRLPVRRGSRRGSIYVVVVAGLAVLGLITLTLSYTAQMEEQAARNWSEGMQARVAAISGMPAFPVGAANGAPQSIGAPGLNDPRAPQLFNSFTQTASSQAEELGLVGSASGHTPASLAASASRLGLGASRSQRPQSADLERAYTLLAPAGGGEIDFSSFLQSGLAYHRIEDESAKFNLNAILPAQADLSGVRIDLREVGPDFILPDPLEAPSVRQFGRFIDAVLERRGIGAAASGEELAAALVAYRYGPDGEPGVAGYDDNANGPDQDSAFSFQVASLDGAVSAPPLSAAQPVPMNADGRDNNRDGVVDEPEESIENDGIDNNHDGRIDEAGEGIDDPAEFRADIRLQPFGDDRPFTRIENLRSVPGFTPEIIEALRPFVTVFSASRTGSFAVEGAESGFLALDPNTATAEEMFAMLRVHYPDLPEALIGQYVANIVDRRDLDHVPSELTLGALGETYIGIEITPYINEVCSDVATFSEDGDDGQYLELFNPYNQTFDLNGWRIETGTSTVYLRNILPPGGLLVLTDNYNEPSGPDGKPEPGYGSLYDIFGVVPTGLNRMIQVAEQFDLPDTQGTVRLYDNRDVLVDSFTYTEGQYTGVHLSFQRSDPRVRYAKRDYATPLELNPGYVKPTFEEQEGLKLFEALHNQPFRSALELLFVSTAYSPSDGEPGQPRWRFPSLTRGATDNLDISVIDLFQPGTPPPQRVVVDTDDFGAAVADESVRRLISVLEQPPAWFGRINVNTAAPAVLAALPGVGPNLAARIDELRGEPLTLGEDFARIASRVEPVTEPEEEASEPVDPTNTEFGAVPVLDDDGFAAYGFGASPSGEPASTPASSTVETKDGWFTARSPQSPARWRSFSEFIRDRDLWGEASLVERIERTYPFSRMIAFQSLSYKVTTANIPLTQASDSNRRSSVMYTERILAADRGALETVVFLYGPRVGTSSGAR
jgi:hypothetical protein